MRLARLSFLLAVLAAGSALSATSHAAAGPSGSTVLKPSALYTALFLPSAPVHGLMAFLDPETGLIGSGSLPLTMTDDMRPQVAVESLFEVQMPDGSFMMDLQGTGEHFTMLEMDATGLRRHVSCADHAHHAPHTSHAFQAPAKHVLLPYAER